MAKKASLRSALNLTVLVAALGYFVDIFDLLLFGIVRIPSLAALGVPEAQRLEVGGMLDLAQTMGLLLGGIAFGILGDRKGRLSTLFASIALYSVANLANAFVDTIPAYAVWRFLAGFGLAGELGAAITLVSEVLPKESRGFGTAIVAAIGVSGAVVGNVVAKTLDWRGAYIVGGLLGLLLLALSIKMAESSVFKKTQADSSVRRGDFLAIFRSRERALRYFCCILIAVPLWFGVGILIKYAPEIAQAIGVQGEVSAGDAIAYCYTGLVLGDVASGFLSQWLGSRKKVIAMFLGASFVCVVVYLFVPVVTVQSFLIRCFFCGLAWGYWAVFMTVTAEQFGTNLRATVTTTVPNFVRASVSPMLIVFVALRSSIGPVYGAFSIGVIVFAVAAVALYFLKETHDRDLDFLEGHRES